MKGVLFSTAILSLILIGMGCQTVPRHLVKEEVIVYYPPEYPIINPRPIGGPHPLPPPTDPITNPKVNNPIPPRDGNPDNSNNGGSYIERDPLRGGSNRNPGETKIYPPVKKSGQNDRVQ